MLKTVAALAIVIGLMLGLSAILRRLRVTGAAADAQPSGRLRVAAALPIDLKHRAVIVACDGEEHLVILGGEQPAFIKTLPPKVVS